MRLELSLTPSSLGVLRISEKAVLLLLLLAASSIGNEAKAEITFCRPESITTRVLNSPAPNDIHPDWTGNSHIGMGWNLIKYGSTHEDGVQFIKGKLLPPFRGANGYTYKQYINSRGNIVWGISTEWECN